MGDATGAAAPDRRPGLRLGPGHRATIAWTDAEFYLGTASGERRWNDFWDTVRTARRRYAWVSTVTGLVLGVVAGRVAATVALEPGAHVVPVVAAYLGVLVFAWWWGRVLRWSVAPILVRNAQRFCRLAYVLVGFLVLLSSPFFDAYPLGWGVVAGTLVALPWLVSAAIETRRAVPDYPTEWKAFDSG
jgi:hypothetical protein